MYKTNSSRGASLFSAAWNEWILIAKKNSGNIYSSSLTFFYWYGKRGNNDNEIPHTSIVYIVSYPLRVLLRREKEKKKEQQRSIITTHWDLYFGMFRFWHEKFVKRKIAVRLMVQLWFVISISRNFSWNWFHEKSQCVYIQ